MAVPAGSDNGFSPFDIWVPINDKMTMSKAYDLVLGYDNRYFDGINFSVETYYKKFRDLLYFKNEITYSKDVSDLFYVGDGRAFGVEFFAQKKIGDFTGTAGYTTAWTYRKYSQLNSGNEFFPKYDRRHDLSLSANYQLNENWKLGAVFTYATGQGYTQGVGRYRIIINNVPFEITLPGKLFNHRLSPYHRMVLTLPKKLRSLDCKEVGISRFIMCRNRRNVWFKQFDNSKNPPKITDVKLLPIIPTFGFDFSF